MDKNIGFIGLGIMGNPMSKNLIKAGYNVIVWNRTESRMAEVVSAGGTPAKSAADVAGQCDLSITMLTDSPVVEELVLGPRGHRGSQTRLGGDRHEHHFAFRDQDDRR